MSALGRSIIDGLKSTLQRKRETIETGNLTGDEWKLAHIECDYLEDTIKAAERYEEQLADMHERYRLDLERLANSTVPPIV